MGHRQDEFHEQPAAQPDGPQSCAVLPRLSREVQGVCRETDLDLLARFEWSQAALARLVATHLSARSWRPRAAMGGRAVGRQPVASLPNLPEFPGVTQMKSACCSRWTWLVVANVAFAGV